MSKNANEVKIAAPDPVEEAKKILAEAEAMKAEAEAMKVELEAEKKAIAEPHSGETLKKAEPDDGDELVEIRLFKDSGAYRDDLTVGVNGEIIKIQRGKTVKIKKKFARVIEQSNLQDAATAELIEEKSNEFIAEVNRITG